MTQDTPLREYLALQASGVTLTLEGPATDEALTALTERINEAKRNGDLLIELRAFVTDPFGTDPQVENCALSLDEAKLITRMREQKEQLVERAGGLVVPAAERVL